MRYLLHHEPSSATNRPQVLGMAGLGQVDLGCVGGLRLGWWG
jgi:hypothetical protein